MSAKPRKAPSIAAISAKRNAAMSTKSQSEIDTQSHVEEATSSYKSEVAEAKTLPKLTLYAHADVLRAIKRIAVEDGVLAQVIMRKALQDYLATRGYQFTDLTTGK